MSTYQTTYSAAPAVGLAGQVANMEAANIISRTVESSAGIAFGQPAFRGSGDHGVIVGTTQAGTAVGAAVSGNTGDGTITAAPTVGAGAKAGVYTVTIVEPGTNLGEFILEDPDGINVGNGVVATEYDADGLTFTVADGATDFAAGDQFTITVTLTANAKFVGLAVLNEAVLPDSSNPDKYPQYFAGAFMTQGQMYVTAGATVVDGDPVYWDPSDSRYTNVATHVPIPDAFFDTGGSDGSIVEISLKNRSA